MLKETKFNYGFLFVSAALPPIVDALFGKQWALAAVVVIFCLGLVLLVLGHFPRLRRRAKFTFIGSVIALAIIGVSWAIEKSKPTSETPQKRLANVALAYIGPYFSPATGFATEMRCVNDSDFPANNELCRFSESVALVDQHGNVSQEDQDKIWANLESSLRTIPPKAGPKTLEPHSTSVADAVGRIPIPQDLFQNLFEGKSTPVYAGVIFWSDDGGTHRKEFCKWLIPPASPYTRLSELRTRDCYEHNGLVY